MIKGFIFDLDGVLVDTVDYHYASWEKLAKQLGFKLQPTIKEKLKGISRMDSLELVLKQGKIKASAKQKIAYAAQKNEWYLEFLENLNDKVILKGVKTFIEKSQKAKIKLTVGSASKNATSILQKTSLKDSFIEIVDGNHVKYPKPHPEVFLKAAKAMKLKPQECIVFEDSNKGLQAAVTGKFRRLGIGEAINLDNAEVVMSDLSYIKPRQIINLFK